MTAPRHDEAPPPPMQMTQLITARMVSQAIGTAARFDFATLLAAGPQTVESLAQRTGTARGGVYRLLRGLASVGVFAETKPGTFANTPLSETLRSDVPGSVRPMALFFTHDAHLAAWRGLDHAVKTEQSGFEHIHGMSPWDMVTKDRELAEVFNGAMTGFSAQIGHAVVEAYDFSGFDELVDIGGGHGMLLSLIAAANPRLQGVLFDLPHVVAGAAPVLEAGGAAARVRVVGGDFFDSVPSSSAYISKSVLHDWGDADCLRILKSIHRAAKPGARLLLVESVIAPGNDPDMGKLIDLEMLVMTQGGRERTAPEWTGLLAEGGFRLDRIVPTRSPACVIESTRV